MTNIKSNKLIIQVSLQNFAFCIKNESSKEISHFKNIPINSLASLENQLETIFSQNELLQVSYDDVLVLHDNNLNTFVPDDFFNEKTLGSYLQYNVKVFATDFFAYDDLNEHQMKNIYVPYVAYNNFFIDQFGAFTYKHINSNLAEYVLEQTQNVNETTVHCNVEKNHFEIIICNKGKLLLFNSFEIQTPEDFIYYILFSYEQLKLNPEQTPIHLFGNIEKDDLNYRMVYNYIRNIFIIDSQFKAQTFKTEANHLKNNFILLHS